VPRRLRVPTGVLHLLAAVAAVALAVALGRCLVAGTPTHGMWALTGLAAALAWLAFLGHLRDGPTDHEEDGT
jgi:hypothetical protein